MQQIYRQQALESHSSPDQLDQLMRVVRPHHWLALLTCAVLVTMVFVWSLWGKLSIAAAGRGVLIRPHKLVAVQTQATGRLAKLDVQVGTRVKSGDVLGLIDQAETRQQIWSARTKLQALLIQDETKSALQAQQEALQDKQVDLDIRALELQQYDISKRLRDARDKTPMLFQRLENRKRLEVLGILPKASNELIQAEEGYRDNQNEIAQFKTKLKQLESDLKRLNRDAKSFQLKELESSTSRKNQIQELRHQISLLELQLSENSQIISPYDGRIVELTVQVGQIVSIGYRLGSIEVEDVDTELVGVTYFPIEIGKKIAPGMSIQITPDIVKRARFGSIVGHVKTVSTFPATREGMINLIGNLEVVEALMANGPVIAVVAELARDPSTVSRYKWSSSIGPALPITSSTTMTSHVILEYRAPITYLIPMLREASGLF